VTTVITLPRSTAEWDMIHFAECLAAPQDGSPIVIDMGACAFTIPGAIVFLLARIHGWIKDGRPVSLQNVETCPALQYLQRMDFFAHCGIGLEEKFARRDPRRRFVPIKRVDRSESGQIGDLAVAVADCIFPELADSCDPDKTGLYDAVWYSISEMALNVVQHSRSDGFAHAQVYPRSGVVRLAIADYGIGIRNSFEMAESPHWHPEMSDLDAINTAMQPRVSSRTHLSSGWGGPVNAGVGLTLLSGLAAVTGGEFCLFSNRGFLRLGHDAIVLPGHAGISGTVCAITIPQTNIKNFAVALEQAKRNAGLLGNDTFSGMFS